MRSSLKLLTLTSKPLNPKPYMKEHPLKGFLYYAGFNLVLVNLASIPVVYLVPEAAGSGIPEVLTVTLTYPKLD